jgi:probable HAF family extracellular repeat protein
MRNKLSVTFTILCTITAVGATAARAQSYATPSTSHSSTIQSSIFGKAGSITGVGRIARRTASSDQTRPSALATPAPLGSPNALTFTFGTVDFPKAANSSAGSINDKGQVAGAYGPDLQPYSPGIHGFRLSGTTFKTLDYPGAVTTYAAGLNKTGTVVGDYSFEQSGLPYHGFIYASNVYSTFDYPGPGATVPGRINDSGQVTGSYYEGGNGHAFLYSNAVFTLLDVPGSNYTQGSDINKLGEIVGVYTDASNHDHGFLYRGGTFTTIDYPGASDTWLLAINDKGQMVGAYGTGPLVQGFNIYHGFLDDNGTFSSFDPSFAGAAVTLPYGINNKSQITGTYQDTNETSCGFFASFK